jgi:phage baseplate assembly protein V
VTGVEVSHVVVGEVSKLADADPVGKVKVKYPHLDGVESGWCPVVTPMAGPGRGMVFLPEVGDHVLVALECGDPARGFVLGAIWSGKQKPPKGDGKPAANNVRYIRSRSGHEVRLDDTSGAERVEVIDKDGARKVVIDSANKKIQVASTDGAVEVTAGSGDVTVKASGTVTVEGATVTVKASGELTIQAGGTLTLKGATVNIN